jgi:DNA-binding MarR family transcriptional regulator
MTRDAAFATIESEVGVLLRRVKRVLGERARAVHPDLHPIVFHTLSHVLEHGPLRAARLVEELGVDKGAISRQVQQLVDLGLVERAEDPDDGRASLLVATDDARQRVAAMTRSRRARFESRLGDWSDADLDRLATLLARYNASLND